MKWYSDFVFWLRSSGNILETESLLEGAERDHAQKLARRHRATVAYAQVGEYFVEPESCPECGEIMPESGPCWHNMFEEEESIPFDGRPMAGPERTAQDIYGLESR